MIRANVRMNIGTRALLVVPVLVLGTACAPPYAMVKKQGFGGIPSLQPKSGKATLVIVRNSFAGQSITFLNYLDKEFIGTTKHKCFFFKNDIEPGAKHVSVFAENGRAVKVDFEANKIYCLREVPNLGVWKARVSFEAIKLNDLESVHLPGCTYIEYNPGITKRPLTNSEFQDVIQGAPTLILGPDGSEELR